MNTSTLVQKLWNYCNVLRDDGMSHGDYVEQLTYLLFLKMSEEQRQLGLADVVPDGLDWPSLLKLSGDVAAARKIFDELRGELEAAGFHTRSHTAP